MKKTISLFLLMLTFISSNAQSYDSVSLEEITINSFSFNQTENSLISLIGSPQSIEDYYSEIDNENWKDYKYSNNSFYFFNNKLIEFNLRTAEFYLINPTIKVGNNSTEVNAFFPNSYSKRSVSGDKGFITINIKMSDNTISDTFILINYNKVSNIITSINTASK
jgi:hypothetical protein